jgi:hypothetical protein
MKELAGGDPVDILTPRTAETRPAPGYRIPVKKPQAVGHNARRAEAMIGRLAAGDRAGALAMVSEADLRRRKDAEHRKGPDAARALLEALRKGNEVMPDKPIVRVAWMGRERTLEEAVELGYQPTGTEGREP